MKYTSKKVNRHKHRVGRGLAAGVGMTRVAFTQVLKTTGKDNRRLAAASYTADYTTVHVLHCLTQKQVPAINNATSRERLVMLACAAGTY